jgi:hypothetical protein
VKQTIRRNTLRGRAIATSFCEDLLSEAEKHDAISQCRKFYSRLNQQRRHFQLPPSILTQEK